MNDPLDQNNKSYAIKWEVTDDEAYFDLTIDWFKI